jgi:hypothetical protein
MALGSFGTGFADAFNQSYNTFRQARLEREQKEKDKAMGAAVASAYGFDTATPEEKLAAATAEGRLPPKPGALQRLGLQKTPAAPVVNTTEVPVQTTEARQIAQNVAGAPEIPQLNTALPTRAGGTAPIASAPSPAPLPAAPPTALPTAPQAAAAEGQQSVPATGLTPTQEQARQPFVDFETSKKNALEMKVAPDERFTTSAQFEKIALEAARQGKSDVALQMFQKAKETKLQVVGAQLLDYAMSNDAKGLESFLNDVNDGHDAKIKMNPDGTVMFAYGNNPPRQFPSLEMVARMANSMMAQDPEGMYNIFKEKVSQERQDRLDKKDVERTDAAIAESIVGTKIKEAQLPFVGLQAQAELGLTKAQTASANRANRFETAPGAISKEATTAYNSELTRIRNLIVTNTPELKGQALQDEIQTQLDPWFNNSPYGPEVARALQGSSGGGGRGGAPKPPAAALPATGPKIVQDEPLGAMGSAIGRSINTAKAQGAAQSKVSWRRDINPSLTELRAKLQKNETVNQSDLNILRKLIKSYPASFVEQYVTKDERKLLGVTK